MFSQCDVSILDAFRFCDLGLYHCHLRSIYLYVGKSLYSLEEKWTELQKLPDVPDKHMYIAEMRKLDKYKHPLTGEWVKTVVDTDMKDTVPPYWDFMMPYWDRFDEGVFVGGPLSGSPLHVDQVQWSNIGKNWDGCKLMALWKYGTDSHDFLDKHLRKLFVNTDDQEEMNQLLHACKIVIAQPGDLFIFSGANPHAVMCMGDSLSMTGYESFVNLNPVHAQVRNPMLHCERFFAMTSLSRRVLFATCV